MAIQVLALLVAVVTALASAYLAYKDRSGLRRRLAVLVALVAALLTAALAIEEYARAVALDEARAALDREWLLLQHAHVQGIEVEVLAHDGYFLLDEFLARAADIRLEIDGLGPGQVGFDLDAGVPLDALFGETNLASPGRMGVPRVTGSTAGSGAGARIDSVGCLASAHTTALVRKVRADGKSANVCSIAVRLPVKAQSLRLSDIAQSERLALSFLGQQGLKCFGPCGDMLFSVRLLFGRRDGILDTMLEISPQILQKRPEAAVNDSVTYELTGPLTIDLAEQAFKHSLGNRRRDWFIFTGGLINALYRTLTRKTMTMLLVGTAWTTEESPSEAHLLAAVPPDVRVGAIPFRADEWCGFGDRDDCWYRFLIFSRPSPLPVGG